mmetsp:Transcript_23517/g.42044  ORF Transcript_23517/g.42044 Transcript_23517/m.42044 type:complete len:266 (-) Transcript_23517:1148-1945(-)
MPSRPTRHRCRPPLWCMTSRTPRQAAPLSSAAGRNSHLCLEVAPRCDDREYDSPGRRTQPVCSPTSPSRLPTGSRHGRHRSCLSGCPHSLECPTGTECSRHHDPLQTVRFSSAGPAAPVHRKHCTRTRDSTGRSHNHSASCRASQSRKQPHACRPGKAGLPAVPPSRSPGCGSAARPHRSRCTGPTRPNRPASSPETWPVGSGPTRAPRLRRARPTPWPVEEAGDRGTPGRYAPCSPSTPTSRRERSHGRRLRWRHRRGLRYMCE